MELASPEVIAALRAWWQDNQVRARTDAPAYVGDSKAYLAQIQEDYKASEEKREQKRAAQRAGVAARRAAKEKAENARWEAIWKEKHEDPNYYAR